MVTTVARVWSVRVPQGIIYSAITDAAPTRAETVRLAECADAPLPGTAARPSAARHFLAVGIHRHLKTLFLPSCARIGAVRLLAWDWRGGISFIASTAARCVAFQAATQLYVLRYVCRIAMQILIVAGAAAHSCRHLHPWSARPPLCSLLASDFGCEEGTCKHCSPHGESAHATDSVARAQALARVRPVKRGDWPARLRATSGLIVTTHMTAAEGGWSHNSGQRVLESRVRYGHGYQISRTEQCGARDNAWRTTIASAGATARFRFEARLSGRGVTTESERIAAMGLVVLGVCAQFAAPEDTSEGLISYVQSCPHTHPRMCLPTEKPSSSSGRSQAERQLWG